MKKSQLLVATLCVSALVLGSCTLGKTTKKKKKSSSVSDITDVSRTSVTPGTSATSATSATPGSSGTSVVPGTSSSGTAPVVVPVQSVSVSPASSTLEVGGSVTLTATVSPDNATNKNVSWSVSPASGVVSVSASGVVTATGAGDATVTATAQDGSGKYGSATIHVNAPAKTWSADEKALFAKYSYGVEIPYMEIEGASLYYDTQYGCLTYGGGESSAALIDEYAALFDEAWQMKKADEESYGYAYVGGAWFETSEGDRYIDVCVYALDEDENYSEDGTGTFGVDITDPLFYSWADFAEAMVYAAQYILEDETVDPKFPEFTGTVEYIEPNDSYIDQGEYFAFVTGPSEAEITSYIGAYASAAAQADGWKFDGSETSQGVTFYSFHNGQIAVSLANYNGDMLVDISLYIASSEEWPTDDLNLYVTAINDVTASYVPAYEGGALYRYYEMSGMFYIAIFAGEEEVTREGEEPEVVDPISQAGVNQYISGLPEGMFTAQWQEGTDTSGEAYAYWLVTANDYGNIQFAVAFNEADPTDEDSSSYVFFQIQALTQPFTSFPGEEITAYYTGLGIDAGVIPAYPIAEAYYRHDAEADATFGGYTLLAEGTLATDMASYAALFTEADGWTVTQDSYGDYVCERGLVRVKIQDWVSYYGFVALIFSAKAWSADQIASFEEHLHGVVLPYLDEFDGLEWDEDYEEFSDYLYVGDCVASVQAALLAVTGWEADSGNPYKQTISDKEYTFYNFYFGSDEEYVTVQLIQYEYSADYPIVTRISVYYTEPATEWSEEQIAQFEETLAGYVPAFDELTSSFTYYEEEGDTGFYENLDGDKLSELIAFVGADGFEFSESYEDQDGDTHNVYVKAVEEGDIVYDICVYEYQGATVTYVDLYLDAGGDVPPAGEGATLVLSKDIMSDTSGYHNAMVTVTVDADHVWSIKDANNNANNAKWDFVKFGQKAYDHTGADADFIETEFVASGSTVTINFKGNGTVDGVNVKNVKLENITAIRVYVSDTAFGQAVCTDSSKLVFEATDLPTGSADLDYVMNLGQTYEGYFQIVIEHTKDGTNNGSIVVKGVIIA